MTDAERDQQKRIVELEAWCERLRLKLQQSRERIAEHHDVDNINEQYKRGWGGRCPACSVDELNVEIEAALAECHTDALTAHDAESARRIAELEDELAAAVQRCAQLEQELAEKA